MSKVRKIITGDNRDEAGQRLLALSHISMGIVNRYPHRIQGFVESQHKTIQNTAQILREQEMQRQAAKKANRMKNRALIGGVAGMAMGGIGAAAIPSLGMSSLAGMQAGGKMGMSIAGGDMSGFMQGMGGFTPTVEEEEM